MELNEAKAKVFDLLRNKEVLDAQIRQALTTVSELEKK